MGRSRTLAIFRAYGYHTRDLIMHYVKLSLAVGLVGSALGVAVPDWHGQDHPTTTNPRAVFGRAGLW